MTIPTNKLVIGGFHCLMHIVSEQIYQLFWNPIEVDH